MLLPSKLSAALADSPSFCSSRHSSTTSNVSIDPLSSFHDRIGSIEQRVMNSLSTSVTGTALKQLRNAAGKNRAIDRTTWRARACATNLMAASAGYVLALCRDLGWYINHGSCSWYCAVQSYPFAGLKTVYTCKKVFAIISFSFPSFTSSSSH